MDYISRGSSSGSSIVASPMPALIVDNVVRRPQIIRRANSRMYHAGRTDSLSRCLLNVCTYVLSSPRDVRLYGRIVTVLPWTAERPGFESPGSAIRPE